MAPEGVQANWRFEIASERFPSLAGQASLAGKAALKARRSGAAMRKLLNQWSNIRLGLAGETRKYSAARLASGAALFHEADIGERGVLRVVHRYIHAPRLSFTASPTEISPPRAPQRVTLMAISLFPSS